jgi:hypothetical protein
MGDVGIDAFLAKKPLQLGGVGIVPADAQAPCVAGADRNNVPASRLRGRLQLPWRKACSLAHLSLSASIYISGDKHRSTLPRPLCNTSRERGAPDGTIEHFQIVRERPLS